MGEEDYSIDSLTKDGIELNLVEEYTPGVEEKPKETLAKVKNGKVKEEDPGDLSDSELLAEEENDGVIRPYVINPHGICYSNRFDKETKADLLKVLKAVKNNKSAKAVAQKSPEVRDLIRAFNKMATQKEPVFTLLQYAKFLASRGFVKVRDTRKDNFGTLKYEMYRLQDKIYRVSGPDDSLNFFYNSLGEEYNDGIPANKIRLIYEEWMSEKGMMNSNKVKSDAMSNLLPMIDRGAAKETEHNFMFYFSNCAIEVTADGFRQIKYNEENGYVFPEQLTEKADGCTSKFSPTIYKEIVKELNEAGTTSASEFEKFLEFATNHHSDMKRGIESAIAYLLKMNTPDTDKAVVFTDANIHGDSSTSEGRRGKGVITKAVSIFRRNCPVDCRKKTSIAEYDLGGVTADTTMIELSDIDRNFELDGVYNLITDFVTVNEKYQRVFKLRGKYKPKVVITSNFSIRTSGASDKARFYEFSLSDFFSDSNTPEVVFGRRLFAGWDEKEYMRFYLYIFNVCSSYLKNGSKLLRIEDSSTMTGKIRHMLASVGYESLIVEGLIYKCMRLSNDKLYINIPNLRYFFNDSIIAKDGSSKYRSKTNNDMQRKLVDVLKILNIPFSIIANPRKISFIKQDFQSNGAPLPPVIERNHSTRNIIVIDVEYSDRLDEALMMAGMTIQDDFKTDLEVMSLMDGTCNHTNYDMED